ncbi:MBL fold metallo-hydrolase [Brevundimonas sp. Root1279]|uniref:MBL fold metallo-hydrolase n=1 Tax=Brevundimonas sp. Root1279 TaxID=1736443 RepID=UPI0006F559FC|nr:MBL fold metallo-hydrolase [Brevundimonas sp. Root1279]KQW82276.1 hypothetical protein ASC65_08360 [Brevundimonas sp. Root1279]
MTLHPRLAAAGLMLSVILAACSEPAEPPAKAPEPAAPAPAVAANTDVQAFQVGQLQLTALRDGGMALPATNAQMSPWANTAEAEQLLTANGVADKAIHLSIQPLLVRDGDRIVLIDTGAAGEMGTDGRLLASLATAGVTPDQVTDILISHGHGDHVGGLFAKDGTLAFPNAAIRISIPEWAAMHDDDAFEEKIRTMTPRVRPFAPGSKVTPSITAVSLDGHTPGHTGYEIVSGTERLLYFGDAMHSAILSVQRPDWTNAWDADNTEAKVTRQRLLNRAASDNLRVYGVHFPFPGLGRIQRRDDGFVWVPEAVAP